MIHTLISSKTRIKLLVKFFLYPASSSLSLENQLMVFKLNDFRNAGMMLSDMEGHREVNKANTKHPLFSGLSSIVRKYAGIDWIVDYVANEIGNLEKVYLTRYFAKGIDNEI